MEEWDPPEKKKATVRIGLPPVGLGNHVSGNRAQKITDEPDAPARQESSSVKHDGIGEDSKQKLPEPIPEEIDGVANILKFTDSPIELETHQQPEVGQLDFVERPKEGQFYRVFGLDIVAKFTGTQGVETKLYKFALRGIDFFVPKNSSKLLHVDELELDQTPAKKLLDLAPAPSCVPPNTKNLQAHPLPPPLQPGITSANPSEPLEGGPKEIRIALPSKPKAKNDTSADNEPQINP